MATNKKKIRKNPKQNLNRRPTTDLDARCLEWRRRSRARAEARSGALREALAGDAHPPPVLKMSPSPGSPLPGPDFKMNDIIHNNHPDLNVYLPYINVGFDEGRRQKEEEQWKLKHDSMFPVFLSCKFKTKDWADPNLALKDWKPSCNCRLQPRTVDVLDILSRSQVEINFCACSPNDQVRLLQAGYIGGSPQTPRAAISIRLVRTYHILWKHCTQRYKPFSEALNEILDPAFPLLVDEEHKQVTHWNRQISQAVDAYRAMLTMEENSTVIALELSVLAEMACTCPACFGPGVSKLPNGEPDVVVCMDCNFQQRRHLAASVERTLPTYPSLFIPPERVESMRQKMEATDTATAQKAAAEMVDPCTQAHTAANDVRGKKDWKGNDETGIAGMGCRHDQILRFINIVQSGEKAMYPHTLIEWILEATAYTDQDDNGKDGQKVAILYDIGCNIRKGIDRRNLFAEERAKERLMFATSLFHSYVHEWSCQLEYNPRLNELWGLSDGEGMERIWAALAVLVAVLRYSTKQHRLTALHFLCLHLNEKGRAQTVTKQLTRLYRTQKELGDVEFQLTTIQQRHGWDITYFRIQWERKKRVQLAAISKKRQAFLEELGELLDLEERLVEAQAKFKALQRKKSRSSQSKTKKNQILAIPSTLVLLEDSIRRVTEKLGSPEFRAVTKPGDIRAQALVKLVIAKTKLYDAKVGVMEHRRRSSERRGTKVQQYLIKIRTNKNADLRKKVATYLRHANSYNEDFEPDPKLATPTVKEVEEMEFGDPFLDCGNLSHPQEPWAVDADTQEGIQAYLIRSRCKEELRRLTKEARQTVKWALEYQGRLDNLAKDIEEGNLACWARNMEMMRALHHSLLRQACRLWLHWNPQIRTLIARTSTPEGFEQLKEDDELLFAQWQDMMARCIRSWEEHVGRTLVAVDEDGALGDAEAVGDQVEVPDMDDDDEEEEEVEDKKL
ncbi:hypothetical protein DFH28DRAFT_1221503 [Melampsora americana]|nr:hypothetical protein DFH28DRAFT_1221503 [Melampsora americana]